MKKSEYLFFLCCKKMIWPEANVGYGYIFLNPMPGFVFHWNMLFHLYLPFSFGAGDVFVSSQLSGIVYIVKYWVTLYGRGAVHTMVFVPWMTQNFESLTLGMGGFFLCVIRWASAGEPWHSFPREKGKFDVWSSLFMSRSRVDHG